MKIITFFVIALMPSLIFSQVITIQYDSDKARATFGQMNVSNVIKARIFTTYSGLLIHHTLKSDGNQIFFSIDSLSQKCGYENMSIYPFNQILVKTDSKWLDYRVVNGTVDSQTIYQIEKSNDDEKWNVDSLITKYILGYKCHKAVNQVNKEKIAWVTLELPFSLSPYDQLNLTGVVLEYFDGSTRYLAKSIALDNVKEKISKFDPADIVIQTCENNKDFAQKLMSIPHKISTDMFICREE